MKVDTTPSLTPCPACGHNHAGPSLAWICVGCPCEMRGPVRLHLAAKETGIVCGFEPNDPWSIDGPGLTEDPSLVTCEDCLGRLNQKPQLRNWFIARMKEKSCTHP